MHAQLAAHSQMSSTFDLSINGRPVRVSTDAQATLLDVLRNELGLRAARFGCGLERCGACMVLVDAEPVYACTRLGSPLAEKRILTIEGLVEDGQGVLAAVVQIAAEELDVEPSRVRIVSGDTERTPNEGYTTGSLLIEVSGGSIRLVCAEVRHLFVQKLAAELRCDPAELAVAGGKFLRGQTDTGYDYWRLAPSVDLARDATASAPVKHPSEH